VIIIRYAAEGILFFFQIYNIVIFARIILSWFVVGGSINPVVSSIYQVVYGLTEPLLAPIRKLIPPIRLGMGFLDLSPFILLILISLARQMVFHFLYF
jgi:YggT family protein